MQSFVYTIQDAIGIHARPAGMIAKSASAFSSIITLEANGHSVQADRMIKVLAMNVRYGDQITVTAEGMDETAAIDAMKELFTKVL